MQTIQAGTATVNGKSGADRTLKHTGKLSGDYISVDELEGLNWKKGKAPSDYVPGRIVTKGVYHNANGHLPQETGRVWYEADINYVDGKRGASRIVWSNDGLIFVTYDHYATFYEIA